MAFIRCKLSEGIDELTVKNSGASVPQQHKENGWSGNVKGNGTITIQFPEGFDLSQYNASGGTISGNSLSLGYTVNMIGSAGYYNANVSSSTATLTKK